MTEAQQSIPFGMRREQVGLKGSAKRKSKVGSVRCGGCYGVGGKPAELFGISTLLVFKMGPRRIRGLSEYAGIGGKIAAGPESSYCSTRRVTTNRIGTSGCRGRT